MYGEKVSSDSVTEYVEKILMKFDLDRNGALSEQEFIEGCLHDQDLRKMFAISA